MSGSEKDKNEMIDKLSKRKNLSKKDAKTYITSQLIKMIMQNLEILKLVMILVKKMLLSQKASNFSREACKEYAKGKR
jgi:hypothetical protein